MKKYKYIPQLLKHKQKYNKRILNELNNLNETINTLYSELEGKNTVSTRLIKLGALIFFLPILGISELIGIILMGVGTIINLFKRKYPIKNIGSDLAKQIETLEEFKKDLDKII